MLGATWCGFCETMKPQLQQVAPLQDDASTLSIALHILPNRPTATKSAMQANDLPMKWVPELQQSGQLDDSWVLYMTQGIPQLYVGERRPDGRWKCIHRSIGGDRSSGQLLLEWTTAMKWSIKECQERMFPHLTPLGIQTQVDKAKAELAFKSATPPPSGAGHHTHDHKSAAAPAGPCTNPMCGQHPPPLHFLAKHQRSVQLQTTATVIGGGSMMAPVPIIDTTIVSTAPSAETISPQMISERWIQLDMQTRLYLSLLLSSSTPSAMIQKQQEVLTALLSDDCKFPYVTQPSSSSSTNSTDRSVLRLTIVRATGPRTQCDLALPLAIQWCTSWIRRYAPSAAASATA